MTTRTLGGGKAHAAGGALALCGGKAQREGALLALGGGKAHREAKANAEVGAQWRYMWARRTLLLLKSERSGAIYVGKAHAAAAEVGAQWRRTRRTHPAARVYINAGYSVIISYHIW